MSNHPKVKAILINIFGGILKCDVLAEGIIQAAQLTNLKLPLVVRMTGTNADKGRKRLEDFVKETKKLDITVGNDMGDAA